MDNPKTKRSEVIYTRDPAQAIWDRLSLLATASGARRLLAERLEVSSGHALDSRAEGLSFVLSTAREFFSADPGASLTSTALSYYYGTLSLLEATLIACHGYTLPSLEASTRRGHGLGLLTKPEEGFVDSEMVYVANAGFLVEYLRVTAPSCSDIAVKRSYRSWDEIPCDSERRKAFSFFDVIARIPELSGLFRETTGRGPRYTLLHPMGFGLKNDGMSVSIGGIFADLDESEVAALLKEHGAVRASHEPGHGDMWTCDYTEESWQEMKNWIQENRYRSVLARDCILLPLSGITDPLVLNFMALYCISIWVRYRPSLWRRVLDGDLAHYQPLLRLLIRGVHTSVPQNALSVLNNSLLSFHAP